MTIEELELLETAISRNPSLTDVIHKRTHYRDARQRISSMYAELDPKQRAVILDFISRYHVCVDYNPAIFAIANTIDALINQNLQISITTPYDANSSNIKSAGTVAYGVRALLTGWGHKSKTIPAHATIPKVSRPDRTIVIVDDFAGTGDTISASIDHLISIGQPRDRIYICLLYAMDQAIEAFLAKGVPVLAIQRGAPAISGYEFAPEHGGKDAPAIYDALEVDLGVKTQFRRGFGATEALVSMLRTPNNTLPIFWFNGEGSMTPWPCPFPR